MKYRSWSDDKANEKVEPADAFESSEISHSVKLAITARFGRTMGS
jgi:hypothetical protein